MTASRGRQRMAELAQQAEAERQVEQCKLLADLGREPSAAETVLVEQIAALTVRARRLRAQGRDREAADTARLLVRAIARLGVKPGQGKPAETLQDYLARKAAEAAAASGAA